jgi:hypothetical protein
MHTLITLGAYACSMGQMTDHQSNVQQALEGNERVFFHPFEDRIAVWYGGPQINVYNSRTWENTNVYNVRSHGRELAEVEKAVENKLATRGYDRTGRDTERTKVVEA